MTTSPNLSSGRTNILRYILLSSTVVSNIALIGAGNAFAEESVDRSNGEKEDYDTIVVTGQKVARSLQETASSIEVITEEELRKNADQLTVAEILRNAANILYTSNTDAPIIRGIDTKGPVSDGNAYLSKPVPGATINVDGRYLSAAELSLGASGTWDVSSIEVYRGPQTTSQGANSIAGAVVIHTKDPSFEPEMSAQFLYGSRNKKRASLAASGPLSEDFAARVSVDYSGRDTFVDYTNPAFTASDFDLDWQNTNVRAKLLWKPQAIDGLTAKATYSYTKAKRPRNELVTEPYGDLENTSLYQDNQDTENHVGIFDLEYAWGNGLKLHNQLQYSEGKYHYIFAPPYDGLSDRKNKNISNEIRLNFGQPDSKISGVAGFFYWNDKTDNLLDNALGNADTDIKHESYAPYGELSWHVSEKWTLIGGLRYQTDDISHDGVTSYVPDVVHSYKEEFNILLPKISLAYNITDSATIGVLVNKGYNPGGTGTNFRGGEYYTFDEETAWNYEMFTRFSLLEKRLTVNSNIFYTKYDGSQRSVTDYLDGRVYGSIIVNADKAETYGMELDFQYRPNDTFGFFGGVGILKTEISKFTDYRGEDFVGNDFSKAPGFMFNMGADVRITPDFHVSANMRYTDGYYSSDTNDPALRVGSYSVTNVNSSYRINDNFELFVYASNLFNSHAPLTKVADRGTGGTSAYILEPREMGGGVRVRF